MSYSWLEKLPQIGNLPFTLRTKLRTPPMETRHTLDDIAEFPFDQQSMSTLWSQQHYESPHNHAPQIPATSWNSMISKYTNSIAICAKGAFYIIGKDFPPRYVKVEPFIGQYNTQSISDVPRIAWALNPNNPCEPLVLCSQMSVIFVYNCESHRIISVLRGHGGVITSLVVHPKFPHIFCSTSRDFSTRIYDLTLPVDDSLVNVHWPPETVPSQAGAPFGLRMAGEEGKGLGRCITILAGGRSGGHKCDVLGAAFHPRLPVISTCGMDRSCKIWPLSALVKFNPSTLVRVDKPLFSSSKLHAGRIVSVHWVKDDILLTASATTIVYAEDKELPEDFATRYAIDGTVALWQWLSLNRYFPNGQTAAMAHPSFRSHNQDMVESESYRMIALGNFPTGKLQDTPRLRFYDSPNGKFALFMVPGYSQVWVFNIGKLCNWQDRGTQDNQKAYPSMNTSMPLYSSCLMLSKAELIAADEEGNILSWNLD